MSKNADRLLPENQDTTGAERFYKITSFDVFMLTNSRLSRLDLHKDLVREGSRSSDINR